MEKKRSVGVTLYGTWAIIYGIFYLILPFVMKYYLKEDILLLSLKSIGFLLLGGIFILGGSLLIFRDKTINLGRISEIILPNFLFICIVALFIGIIAVLSLSWQGAYEKLYNSIFTIMSIIIPATSIYYFTHPKVKEQFR